MIGRMTWRAAQSLLTLRMQLRVGAPRAAPPATSVDEWGLIGDALHDPSSDHTPHDFPGWGTQIVTAADFPNRPDLGLDAHRVLDDIRKARDPRAKYGISNGQIFSNHSVLQDGRTYDAWTWRPYYGGDGHYTHGHLSVVGDSRADGTSPWPTIGGIEVIDLSQTVPASGTSGTGGKDRNLAQIWSDDAKLRAVWVGELTPAQAGFGPSSPLARLIALANAGPAQPASVDVAALAAALAPLLDAEVSEDAVRAALAQVLPTVHLSTGA